MDLGIKTKEVESPARIWKRLLAFLIDYVIINSFILFPFNRMTENLLSIDATSITNIFQKVQSGVDNLAILVYISIIMGIIATIYFAFLEYRLGQTAGKLIMNIGIRDIGSKRLSIGKAFIRGFVVFFLFTMPILALLDAGYSYFNSRKQRYLEKITNTQTVETAVI